MNLLKNLKLSSGNISSFHCLCLFFFFQNGHATKSICGQHLTVQCLQIVQCHRRKSQENGYKKIHDYVNRMWETETLKGHISSQKNNLFLSSLIVGEHFPSQHFCPGHSRATVKVMHFFLQNKPLSRHC